MTRFWSVVAFLLYLYLLLVLARIIVDITLARGKAPGHLVGLTAHQRAVRTLVNSLHDYRNWYLDLANDVGLDQVLDRDDRSHAGDALYSKRSASIGSSRAALRAG